MSLSPWKNIRYTVRMVRKNPMQFAVMIVTLAVGIGVNAAMFSIIDGVLLRPLPYPDPERIVTLTLRSPEGQTGLPVAYPDYEDWTRQSKTLASITATRAVNFSLLEGDVPERIRGIRVSPNLLTTLGIAPALGRGFRPEEAIPGNEFEVMLTHEFWRARFLGSPGVVGKSLLLGRTPYVVVGVLPPMALPQAAQGPASPQVLVPFSPRPNEQSRGLMFLRVIGRVKSGISIESASAEMQLVNASVEKANPDSHVGAGITLTPIKEWIVGKTRPMVLVLFAAVTLVLLIACANVACILLGRSSMRASELAVRSALGAGRRELTIQLLTEGAVLSLFGAVLGLGLGYAFISMAQHFAGAMLPRADQIGMNPRVLVFTIVTSLLSSLLFGILPALKASRTRPVEAMKRQGRTGGVASRGVLRALLTAELALTLVLVVGSVLAIRSFIRLNSVSPGFTPEGLIAAEVELPAGEYTDIVRCADFFQRAVDRLQNVPGVESVATGSRLPLLGFNQSDAYQVEGQNRPMNDWTSADVRVVGPGYFKTMGIPLLSGRDFTLNDTATSPPVAVVNEEFARRHFPKGAVGHTLQMFPQNKFWREIVGVVGDVKLQSLDANVGPGIYLVGPQNMFIGAARSSFLIVRTKGNPESILTALRQEVRNLDSSQAVSDPINMKQAVSDSLARNRLTMILLLTFGAIALILAAVGVYGVVGLFVSSRMQEIGIRMALGASPFKVLKLIFAETATFSGIAVVIGLAAALVLARSMRQVLFEISTADPLTFAITAATIIATTLLAAMAPTLRAMRADPMVVLRLE